MKALVGCPGTRSAFMLRIGQCGCAAASLAVMASAIGFSSSTAFCYLIASMGLQMLWSFGLGFLDVYAMRKKRDISNSILISLFVVGDWVTSTLSLAATCSSAGVAVLFARDIHFCRIPSQFACVRYGISIGLAFMSWILIAFSSLVMFWIMIFGPFQEKCDGTHRPLTTAVTILPELVWSLSSIPVPLHAASLPELYTGTVEG